jgi:sugar lactone lactonase YvrE
VRILFILLLTGACPVSAQNYAVSTFAGGGFATNVPGPGASLNPPGALALDRSGNVFFTDSLANIVQRLDAKTGLITLVAGNGTAGFSGDNGLAVNAQINNPSGLAIDSAGTLYISDAGNQRIRKVTNGVITTYAGGGTSSAENVPATSALIFEPQGIAVDSSDALYITDGYGAGVRKVVNGIITTAIPNLAMSYAVTVDSAGSIYVIWGLIRNNHTVSKISNGVVQTLATTGPPDQLPNPAAYLLRPQAIAVDSSGTVYVSDPDASRVVTVAGGTFTLVAACSECPADQPSGHRPRPLRQPLYRRRRNPQSDQRNHRNRRRRTDFVPWRRRSRNQRSTR